MEPLHWVFMLHAGSKLIRCWWGLTILEQLPTNPDAVFQGGAIIRWAAWRGPPPCSPAPHTRTHSTRLK